MFKWLTSFETLLTNTKALYHYSSVSLPQGHFEIAEYLLEFADFEYDRSRELYTALSWAAMRGNRALIQLLVNHGASANGPDTTIRSPLFAAVFNGDLDTVNFFLHLGANTEHRDDLGCTPLMLAARLGDAAIVESLLMAGKHLNSVS